jgi:hypothetical protein
MGQIAGRNRRYFRLDAIAVAPEILRLGSVPGPSSGAGAVESQRVADPIIGTAPGEETIDFRRCGMGCPQAELDHAADDRFQPLAPQGVRSIARPDQDQRPAGP